jgi:hypothetical protein
MAATKEFLEYCDSRGIVLSSLQYWAVVAFLGSGLFNAGIASGRSFLLRTLVEWDQLARRNADCRIEAL